MILPKSEDAIHKAQLYRLLVEILDNPELSSSTYFKGGSCAAMLGFLDRFSIDLDFDIKKNINKDIIDKKLNRIYSKLDLEVKQKSRENLLYILRYQSSVQSRNTIKLSFIDTILSSNIYQPFYLSEIDRYAICQTKDTMFANKLVAITDRYKKHRTIAGRDLYDIHYFFLQGYHYHQPIIRERTNKKTIDYLIFLSDFISKKVNDKIITEDLNFLLPYKKFQLIRKVLKKETLMFINSEIERLRNSV